MSSFVVLIMKRVFLFLIQVISLILIKIPENCGESVAPAGATNMVLFRNVCIAPNNDKTKKNRFEDKPCSAMITTYGNHEIMKMCRGLTQCHTPGAHSICTLYNSMPEDKIGAHFLETQMQSFCVNTEDSSSQKWEEVRSAATHRRRAPLMILTGNIGHDLYNSLVDVFALQEKLGGAGAFDSIFVEGNWFTGSRSFIDSINNPTKSWTMSVVEALFNSTRNVPQYVSSHPRMVGEDFKHFGHSGAVCFDELYVKAAGLLAENIGWDDLPILPKLRARVLDHMFGKQWETIPSTEVTMYSREDARRRRFKYRNVDALKQKLKITRFVTHMPRSSPMEQISMFLRSKIFITPFGSNTANAIFMRPGSTFIEVSTLCPDLCTEGCHPYSRVGESGNGSMVNRISGITRESACMNLMADGPPLHQFTGVNYYILPTCSDKLRCRGGAIYQNGKESSSARKKLWKSEFNNDLDLDSYSRIDTILSIIRGSSADSQTERLRVAPFKSTCTS